MSPVDVTAPQPSRHAATGVSTAPEAPGFAGPIAAGVLIVLLFFGGLGGWAAFAPLESAAIASGTVSVDTRRKTVQHLEGGIITALLREEGARVKAGEAVIQLDETQAGASLTVLRDRLTVAEARRSRLQAEQVGADEIQFADWLQREAEGEPKVREILEAQRGIFAARGQALESQAAILRRRIAQYREEIAGLEEAIVSQERQLSLLRDELAGVQRLVDKGLEPKPRLLALERRAAEVEGERANNVAEVARTRQQIAEADLRILDLRTSRTNEVVKELREVQSEILDLNERIGAAADVLERTVVRAPVDGTIVDMRVATAGGVVGPGEPLFDVVPLEDELVVEARLDPNDIDVVYPGLPAQVRLTAFNQRTTPTLSGEVARVSADRLLDPQTGQAYYSARVRMDESQPALIEDLKLYPGMPVEVMIVTGSGTTLDYLLKPLLGSVNRALKED